MRLDLTHLLAPVVSAIFLHTKDVSDTSEIQRSSQEARDGS
jgi:hypothetical protein